MNRETKGPDEQAVLVDLLIEAEDQRQRSKKTGPSSGSRVAASNDLSPEQQEELARLLECADELEKLAASGEPSWSTPLLASAPETDWSTERSSDALQFGEYRVLGLIANGGFGAVLLAEDERNGRRVALKAPRPDVRLTHRVMERFLIEGRAAATLNHPHIVSVLETISDPVPAIVYEYCDGGNLRQRIGNDALVDEQTAVTVTLRLAEALSHAHTRGILHRDVKPANVLLVLADATDPNAVEINGIYCIPKLGDFGLAKVMDDTTHQTQSGVVMGTPQFMAPEQAAGRVAELGTHTDIFSLGAIFYWLLVGRPPFNGRTNLQTLQLIESGNAIAPRRLNPSLSSKAEAVCLKCLRKPIEARYESAAALAEDLRRLLRGDPVSARPMSLWERLQVWGQRNPALAAISIMIPLAATLGLLLQWSNYSALQEYVNKLDRANQDLLKTSGEANEARASAEQQRARYAQLFYATDLQLAQRAFKAGDVRTYNEALLRHVPESESASDLRGPEWKALWNLGHPPETVIDQFPSAVYFVRLSNDGQYLVACGADATIRVYDTDTWNRISTIASGQGEVNYAAFASDNRRLVSAGDDGTIAVWDWRSGEQLQLFDAYDEFVYCAQFFDDDSKVVACARHPEVQVWDCETGTRLARLIGDGNPNRVEQLDVSEDGQYVATASYDGKRRVWNLDTFEPVKSLQAIDEQRVSSVCLFRREDQQWMLSGTLRDGTRSHCSLVLETVNDSEQRILPIHFDSIQAVEVDRGGQLAAAGDTTGRISMIDVNAAIQGDRWWHPETIRKSWVGHSGRVYGLAMADDGRTLISVGDDGKVSRWDTQNQTDHQTFAADLTLRGRNLVHAASAPGAIVVVDSEEFAYRWRPKRQQLTPLIDLHTGEALKLETEDDRVSGSFAIFDGTLFGHIPHGLICAWRLDESHVELLWSAPIGDESPGTYEMDVSTDGRLLAVCRRSEDPLMIVVLDTSGGTILDRVVMPQGFANGARSVRFDRKGTRLVYGFGNDVVVCDRVTHSQFKLTGHTQEIRQICFVEGTPLLITGGDDRMICVWNLSTKSLVRTLAGHRGAIECLGIHPLGNRLVSSDDLGWVRFWSLEDGMLLAELAPASERTWHATSDSHLLGVTDGQTLFRQKLSSPQD